ncbi:hypothetical protein FBU30_002383 [Linnemannia zychae]|nr:hypothetical protein FBU30_002383 [Linnemannia zychae]
MSAPNDPEQLLNRLNNRVTSLEISLQSLEPTLKFFANNLLFFQNISQGLKQHLKHLESSAFDTTPSRLHNLKRVAESFDKAALEDLYNERPPFKVTKKPKSKMAIPEAFFGKRED